MSLIPDVIPDTGTDCRPGVDLNLDIAQSQGLDRLWCGPPSQPDTDLILNLTQVADPELVLMLPQISKGCQY